MLDTTDTRRFAALLAHLQTEIRLARHDGARLEHLGGRMSRLAAEITLACERAFVRALEAQVA
ncbi:MAG: hypothetical protein NVS2B3_05720 [Vulcanimicrobiaceae bacterium]